MQIFKDHPCAPAPEGDSLTCQDDASSSLGTCRVPDGGDALLPADAAAVLAAVPICAKAKGVKAHTYTDLLSAMHAAESYDGLTLIECMLPQNEATEEMVRFGVKISQSNMRPA